MKRASILAVLAALCLTRAAVAQEPVDHTPKDSSDILILSHDFTGPGEFARALLIKNEVYRAELSIDDAVIEVYPIKGGSPVFVYREETGVPSGRGMYLVHPTTTAEYQFRLVSGGPVVSLNVYRDLRRSRRRQKLIDEPGWEIGGEIAVGGHSGYQLNTAEAGIKDTEDGGIDIEGCFSARSGPGVLKYVSICAFGVGYDKRGDSKSVIWVYMEPRIRLLGGRERGVTNNEIGILGRASYGIISSINRDPKMVALGIYAARNVRWNKSGKGLSFTLAYRRGWISNLGTTPGGAPYGKTSSNRLSFAVGYYQ